MSAESDWLQFGGKLVQGLSPEPSGEVIAPCVVNEGVQRHGLDLLLQLLHCRDSRDCLSCLGIKQVQRTEVIVILEILSQILVVVRR